MKVRQSISKISTKSTVNKDLYSLCQVNFIKKDLIVTKGVMSGENIYS